MLCSGLTFSSSVEWVGVEGRSAGDPTAHLCKIGRLEHRYHGFCLCGMAQVSCMFFRRSIVLLPRKLEKTRSPAHVCECVESLDLLI